MQVYGQHEEWLCISFLELIVLCGGCSYLSEEKFGNNPHFFHWNLAV